MSSYEFYDFRAIDRNLTNAEMEELRSYSSRAEISPRGFTVEYNFSSFSGEPAAILAKYFDFYVYVSGWEIRELMIRIPYGLCPATFAEPYLVEEALDCRQHGTNLVLELAYRPEGGGEWAEGEGWMDSLVPVRTALIQGDSRPLYIGWLAGATRFYDYADEMEPPVPPGLSEYKSNYLDDLRKFLKLDRDLVEAAAERSPPLPEAVSERAAIAQWVSDLPADRKDELFTDIVANQSVSLIEALCREAFADAGFTGQAAPGTRTVAELQERADSISREREWKKQEETRREREAHILSLKGREDEIWNEIQQLIVSAGSVRYMDVVAMLLELRELAQAHGGLEEFERRVEQLRRDFSRRPSLMERLNEAEL